MKLVDFSTYRTQLMGIAAMMIIICHAPAHITFISPLLVSILSHMDLGVDIFLFLSGFGLYYSLKKKTGTIKKWYLHRYLKLCIPYLVFAIPTFGYDVYSSGTSFLDYLENVLTIAYWTRGWGLWFIAILLPVYATAPYVYKLFHTRHALAICVLMITGCFIVGNLLPVTSAFFRSLQMCITRYPAFIIGMSFADCIFRKSLTIKKITIFGGVMLTIFLLLRIVVKVNVSLLSVYWVLMLPVLAILLFYVDLRIAKPFNKFNRFMGTISLESYCTNVFLVGGLMTILPIRDNNLNYIVSAIICLGVSYCLHVVSTKILSIIDLK